MSEMEQKGVAFSKTAKREMEVLCRAVSDIVSDTTEVFIADNIEGAKHIEPLEEVIDYLTKRMKGHHVKRLQNGKCTIEMGLILEDMLMNLERISDHCSNIAVEMLTLQENGYEMHEYLDDLSELRRLQFKKEYKELEKKYSLDVENDILEKDSKEKKIKKDRKKDSKIKKSKKK